MKLFRLAQVTTAFAFLLIIAGGLVTSTGSGLAIPDWPLAYGQLVPPWEGGIRFEYSHRLIAAVVALLTFMLAIALWRAQVSRAARWLGTAALGAVLIQAILGGITVLHELPQLVSIAHACLGQVFFCTLASLALVLSPSWRQRDGQRPHHDQMQDQTLARISLLTVIALVVQLVLGAIRRHTGLGLEAHILGAIVATILCGMAAGRAMRQHRSEPLLTRPARWLMQLLVAQWVLGVVAAWISRAVFMRTAHVTVGALLLATSVVLMLRARRGTGGPLGGLHLHLGAYAETTNPRLTWLAVLTTVIGFLLASHGSFALTLFVPTVCGTALVVGGARALNQYLERDVDARMARTRSRPLPSGRLTPVQVLTFGLMSCAMGLASLAWLVNGLTCLLEAIALLSYLFIYTPLKQRSALCTLVGAIPGAIPPLAGWAAARHALDTPAWILGAILFLWQLPHFLAIAWLYREDYARVNFRFLTSMDPRGGFVGLQIVLYTLALLPVTLLPSVVGVSGTPYFYGALALGMLFAGVGLRTAMTRSLRSAKRLFVASIAYLPLLLGLMILDQTMWMRPAAAQALSIYGQVPQFALMNQQGQMVRAADLHGQIWVADFIFTRCSGQCPIMSRAMQRLQQTFGSQLRLLSFTVDPAWDTPERLAAYAATMDAKDGWSFVTGAPDTLRRLAVEGFHLSAATGDVDNPAALTHSVRLTLVDRNGNIRGYYDGTNAEAVQQLRDDLASLLRNP